MNALILACSQAKRDPLALPYTTEPIQRQDGIAHDETDAPKAPAVLVYDSPHWRIVRRWNPSLRVFALSGEYGLFDARLPIRHYDTKMPDHPPHQWMYYNVLFGTKHIFQPFDVVWICVPGGGYARTVDYVVSTLQAGGCTTRFADVRNLLDPVDLALPAHFARTKALSRLCQEHGQGRMPEAQTMDDWARFILEGDVLR